MSTEVLEVMAAAILSAVIAGCAIYWWLRRRVATIAGETSTARQSAALSRFGSQAAHGVPQRGVVVTSGDQELMSMTVLDGKALPALTEGAVKLNPTGFARALEPIMQVAPSVRTAVMANSRRLMEVVVNGDLAAASDGNGLRAWVTNADGIKEHGRLFEPKSLQNVANATAIWQLASVAVAQKHLADISATLQRVESKVDDIQRYMEADRFTVIQSALNYLRVAKDAVAKGEFLERTRNKLEDFDIELERVGLSLIDQIRRETEGKIEHDTFGSEGEYQSALRKHRSLSRHVEELTFCNEVRLANWYLCSLYPDQSKMLEPRLTQIRATLEQTNGLRQCLAQAVEADCDKIEAFWNTHDTLVARRNEVRGAAAVGAKALESGGDRCEGLASRLARVGSDRRGVNRLIVESENGIPTSVYLRSNAA